MIEENKTEWKEERKQRSVIEGERRLKRWVTQWDSNVSWGILSHKHIIYPSVCGYPSLLFASLFLFIASAPYFYLFHSSLFLFASLTGSPFSGYIDTMEKCTSVCWGQNNTPNSPAWWSHKWKWYNKYKGTVRPWRDFQKGYFILKYQGWITAKCRCISDGTKSSYTPNHL